MKATVFLGGGRITSALIAGLRLAGYGEPLVVHDRHPGKLRQLQRQYGVSVEADLRAAVDGARLLMIAVRPESVRGLLEEIAELGMRRRLMAVSLAAGIPLSKLRAGLGPPVRWARAMPSPVARSGRGLTALTFSGEVSTAARAEVRNFFSLVGPVVEIPESRFDAFTVTYSSSHGYFALAALAEAAERIGLDRKRARVAAAHALADGIAAWREGDLTLEQLLREASTPEGIAASVMEELERSGYRKLLVRGLRAGLKQAGRNARLR